MSRRAAIMKLDTYESMVTSGRFVTLPSGCDPQSAGLPNERAYWNLCLVRRAYLLPEVAVDSTLAHTIESQISVRGFALHGFDLALYEHGH